MNLIEEITKVIKEKEREMEVLKKEIEAAYIFKESIEKKNESSIKSSFVIESITEDQELIESVKRKRKKKVKQVEVIAYIAKQIMDSSRRFKVTEVKNIMVAAGYFSKNIAKAYNSVSTPLRRSDIFKQTGAGVFELVDRSISDELG